MSSSDSSPLHLPNLSIEGFRGIKSLWLPKLGRATLLTGRNGVGKTTVLEAARIWAARGTEETIGGFLLDREEIISKGDGFIDQNDGEFVKTLFWGRNPNASDKIVIGPNISDDAQVLKLVYVNSYSKTSTADRMKMKKIFGNFPFPQCVHILRIFGKAEKSMIFGPGILDRPPPDLDYDFESEVEDVQVTWLDPGLSGTRTIVGFWTKFALTPTESRAVDALNVVTKERIERIAVVGDGDGQKIIVKAEHTDAPVPLRNLGDGATRVLAVATAISCCRGGFLFIDEAEIGIHYTAQASFWRMVLQAAYDNDVQVIATTHSFDCVKGFAVAAGENKTVDGILVRIEEGNDSHKAITFDESELEVVASHGIEVR